MTLRASTLRRSRRCWPNVTGCWLSAADLGPLLGQPAGEGTLVGALMGESPVASSPARRWVSAGFQRRQRPRQEPSSPGGKVMKNVTGYDLSRSWPVPGDARDARRGVGEILPAPDQTRTLLLHDLADEAAVRPAMCAPWEARTKCRALLYAGWDGTAHRRRGPSVEARECATC